MITMSKISDAYKEKQLIGCCLLSRKAIDIVIENNFNPEELIDDFNKNVLSIILEKCRFDSEFIPTNDYILDNLKIEEKEKKSLLVKLNRYKNMIKREIVNDKQIEDITNSNILTLRDYSIKRKIIHILKNGLDYISLPAREFLSNIIKDLNMVEVNDGLITEVNIHQGFKDLKEQMLFQKENDIEFGYKFGFRDFDRLIQDNITDGTLTYIVGRPSNYKTGLALNLAQNSAMFGTPTALFSHEMDVPSVYRRILSRVTKIEMNKLKRPQILTSEEWQKLDEAIQIVETWPLYVIDASKLNITQIDATVAYLKAKYGVKIFFEDYFQLIRTKKGNLPNEEWEFASISEELRMIAKNHNVAVIALSQANRSCESRDNKRPTLRDIRNTGKSEQDANNIFYVYRDEFYYGSKSEMPNHLEIGALKIREGELKRVLLYFDGARATLGDCDPFIVLDKSSDYIGGGGNA